MFFCDKVLDGFFGRHSWTFESMPVDLGVRRTKSQIIVFHSWRLMVLHGFVWKLVTHPAVYHHFPRWSCHTTGGATPFFGQPHLSHCCLVIVPVIFPLYIYIINTATYHHKMAGFIIFRPCLGWYQFTSNYGWLAYIVITHTHIYIYIISHDISRWHLTNNNLYDFNFRSLRCAIWIPFGLRAPEAWTGKPSARGYEPGEPAMIVPSTASSMPLPVAPIWSQGLLPPVIWQTG